MTGDGYGSVLVTGVAGFIGFHLARALPNLNSAFSNAV